MDNIFPDNGETCLDFMGEKNINYSAMALAAASRLCGAGAVITDDGKMLFGK